MKLLPLIAATFAALTLAACASAPQNPGKTFLLPTVSNQPRLTPAEKEEYFEKLLPDKDWGRKRSVAARQFETLPFRPAGP